jgi:hypothetical protein
MAEIKIRKKSRTWPWVAAFIVMLLAVVTYLLLYENPKNKEVETEEARKFLLTEQNEEGELDAGPYSSSDLETADLSFIGDRKQLGTDPEFTSVALAKLALTVQQRAKDLGIKIGNDLAIILQEQKMEGKPLTIKNLKNGSEKIVSAMRGLQRKKFPTLSQDMAHVEEVAKKIEPDIEMESQKGTVIEFFELSGDLLKKMKAGK